MADGKQEYDLRVLAFPVGKGGCGFYRVRQLMNSISRDKFAHAHLLEEGKSMDYYQTFIEKSDVIILRGGHFQPMELIKSEYPDKIVILDMDDNTFDVEPQNDAYRYFGTENAYKTNKAGEEIPLWVDQQNDFSISRNKLNRKKHEWMLEVADFVSSPTKVLTSYLVEKSKGNAKGLVIYNSIDFVETGLSKPRTGNKKSLVWHGGSSHIEDLQTVVEPIQELLDDGYNFTSMGSHWEYIYNKEYRDQIDYHPFTAPKAHVVRLHAHDFGIGIIPITDANFNKYKSEIKFVENSFCGIVNIIANKPPYKGFAKHEENCLLYDDPKEVPMLVKRLNDDKKLFDKLQSNAFEWVKEHRNLTTNTGKLCNLLAKLVKAKREASQESVEQNGQEGKKKDLILEK